MVPRALWSTPQIQVHGHPSKFIPTPSWDSPFAVRRTPRASVGTVDRQAHPRGTREYGVGSCVIQPSLIFFPLKCFVLPNRVRQSWSGLYTVGLWYVSAGWAAVRVQSGVTPGGASRPAAPHTPPADLEHGRGRGRGEWAGQWPRWEMGTLGNKTSRVAIKCHHRSLVAPRAAATKNPISSQSPGRVQGHGASQRDCRSSLVASRCHSGHLSRLGRPAAAHGGGAHWHPLTSMKR